MKRHPVADALRKLAAVAFALGMAYAAFWAIVDETRAIMRH